MRLRFHHIFILLFFFVFTGGCGNLFRQKSKSVQGGKGGAGGKVSAEKSDFKKLEHKTALFLEGIILYEQERPEEALHPLKEVLKLDKNFAPAWYFLGKTYRELKNFEKAYEHFKQAYELNPEHKWYGLAYAEILEYNREHKKALEIYEQIYEKNPGDFQLILKLLDTYTQHKEYKKALKLVDDIEKLTGMEREAGDQRIRLLLRMGNVTDAIEEADRLSKLFPQEITWKQHLYNIYTLIGDEENALLTLRQMLEIQPDDFFALHQLFQYEFGKKNYSRAKEYLLRLLNSSLIEDDKKIKVLQNIYTTTDSKQREQLGISEFIKKLQSEKNLSPKMAVFLADVYFAQGDDRKALQYYKQALAQNKENTLLWEQILSIEDRLGRQDSVIKYAEEALETFPEQIIFNYYLGSAYTRKKRYEDAEYYLRKIEKVGSSDNTLMLEVYLMLGEVYHYLGEYEKSDAYYEKALKIAPTNPTVLNNYAYFSVLHGGDLEKAEKMIQKVIEDYPNVPAYADTYGWILYKKGNYREALKWIENAYKNSLNPDPEIIDHLGDVHLKLGNKSQALKFWKEAYEKNKDKKIYEKIRKHSAD